MIKDNKFQKNRIVVLSSAQTFLTRSMQEKLKELNIESMMVIPAIKTVLGFGNGMSGMVIFTSDKLMEDKATLIYIKDYVLEKGIPVFLIGKTEDIQIVEGIFPESIIKGTYMRPVDINEVVHSISHYYSFFHSENRRSILAIDDSGTVLRNVKGMFENKYQVWCADSAAMAIKSMTLHKPDLILLDYDIPIVDGGQIFQMIRSEKDFADIPVMFLTSKEDAATVTAIMQMRPAGYMLKRIPAQQIINNVDNFFRKSKPAINAT